ncbi:hypothetical protein ONZ51_g9743 [Trametes cubensis]|uniref:Uncharacterized protein n=1 Tax=Trametes cubensis TaxID=1111947 RepID=A0AAD7TNC6_9APHY|nr:hypothetical protein ONZ51_g9743 [Trametes cubensis]
MGSPLSADQLETLLRGKWSFWDEYRHEITRIFETMDITFTPLKHRRLPSRPPDFLLLRLKLAQVFCVLHHHPPCSPCLLHPIYSTATKLSATFLTAIKLARHPCLAASAHNDYKQPPAHALCRSELHVNTLGTSPAPSHTVDTLVNSLLPTRTFACTAVIPRGIPFYISITTAPPRIPTTHLGSLYPPSPSVPTHVKGAPTVQSVGPPGVEPELDASPRNSPYGRYTPSPTKRPRLGGTAMLTSSTPSHIGHAASQRPDYASMVNLHRRIWPITGVT